MRKVFCLCLFLLANATGCEDKVTLPDNLATFETELMGFTGDELDIKIMLSRAAEEDIALTVSYVTTNVTYDTQFTTEPASPGGSLDLTIPKGETETAFKVIKVPGIFLNGDEKIDFSIAAASGSIILSGTVQSTLSFSAITSEGGTLTLQGKIGTDPPPALTVYGNAVSVDLSANQQFPINRKSWNLGFYSGNEFRVVLNHYYQSAAAPTTQTDLLAVTQADADAMALSANTLSFAPGSGALGVVDSWEGNLSTTAFAEVSANDSENMVYLLSFEGSKNKELWMKVKVTRNGSGYRVRYARVNETAIKTLDIPKSPDYNFVFASIESDQLVEVEPARQNWDFQWGYSTYNAFAGTPTPPSPYWFQDFIALNNLAGAQAAEIVSADATASAAAYTDFNEASIASITFLTTRDAIGSKWRITAGPGVTNPGIRRDRFYVVKDPRGNVYKLKFVTMGVGSDGGERGKPVIEYKLVMKGS